MVKYKYGVEKLLSLKSKPAMPSKFSTPVPDFCTTPQHNSSVFTRIQLSSQIFFGRKCLLWRFNTSSLRCHEYAQIYRVEPICKMLPSTCPAPFVISFSQSCMSSHLYSTLLIAPQFSEVFLKRQSGAYFIRRSTRDPASPSNDSSVEFRKYVSEQVMCVAFS